MSNKLLLAVILIAFIIGAVCGAALKSVSEPKIISIPGETLTEVVLKKVPVKITETKYVEVEKSVTDSTLIPPLFSFADSVKGAKDSVEYSIIHRIVKEKDSVKSGWNISLSAPYKEYIKEKLTVELKEVEVPEPFYADGWFWAALLMVPLLVLAIVF